MNALTKPSAPDPLQASSVSRPSAPVKPCAVSFHASVVADAARRICLLLSRNPGRHFSRAEIAARLSIPEQVIKLALQRLSPKGFVRCVDTGERGMAKFRYRWRECPA